jgi:predicted dehydrogenase
MGRWHAHAADRSGARIVAVADTEPARAARLAAAHPESTAMPDFERAIDLADVVHVCVPTAVHVDAVSRALARRRHVIAEKPLAPTAAETAALLRLAESVGVLLCPTHQLLFQEGVERAMSWAASAGPCHVDIRMCSAGADGDDERRERIALEILPHPLSLLMRLIPHRPADVNWSILHPRAGELRATAEIAGTTAAILISMGGRPTTSRLEVIGTESSLHVDLFHGFAVVSSGSVSRRRKIAQPFVQAGRIGLSAAANLARRAWRREPAYPGLRSLVTRFYGAVRAGAPPPVSPDETLLVAETCDLLAGLLAARVPSAAQTAGKL